MNTTKKNFTKFNKNKKKQIYKSPAMICRGNVFRRNLSLTISLTEVLEKIKFRKKYNNKGESNEK